MSIFDKFRKGKNKPDNADEAIGIGAPSAADQDNEKNNGPDKDQRRGPVIIELEDGEENKVTPNDAPPVIDEPTEEKNSSFEEKLRETKDKLSFKWEVTKILTYPLWKPPVTAGKVAFNGMKNRKTMKGKIGVPLMAAGALATYFTALTYTGAYGLVAVGDRYWGGQAYASGEKKGTITDLHVVGKFPCDSLEGQLSMPNIGRDGSSTFEFSARRLEFQAREDLWRAYDEGATVSLHFNQSHLPTSWFDAESEGWFAPNVGVLDVECIQKTDFNITHVEFLDHGVDSNPKVREQLTPEG